MPDTDTSQASLGTFDTEDSETNPENESTSEKDEQTNSDPTIPEQTDLPDITGWNRDTVVNINGVRALAAHNPEKFVSLPNTTGIYKHEVFYLLDNFREYLNAFDCHSLSIPQHYSKMDEMDPVITKVTTGNNNGGRGITGRKLENALRYIAGKGGFKHSKTQTFVGPHDHFLLVYDGEPFIVGTEELTPPDDTDYEPNTVSVKGMEIPDDDPRIARHIDEYLTAIETHTDVEITGYIGQKESKHKFTTKDSTDLSIRGYHVKKLDRTTTNPSDIAGEMTIKTDYDETYTVELTEDEIEHEIGDELWNGFIIGYQRSYEDPRSSSRAPLSGSIKVHITYHYLLRDENNRFELRSKNDVVRKLTPKNESYDPLATGPQ